MANTAPQGFLFSKEHEWIKVSDGEVQIGISEHAQGSLGDIVYVELPEVGAHITKGAAIGVVESVKAVSDIFAPVTGTVRSINQNVIEQPELINSAPYGEGWLLTVKLENQEDIQSLLSPDDYDNFLHQEAKS